MGDELERIEELERAVATLRGRRLSNADKIQGRPISAAAPNDNELIGWNATTRKFEPKAPTIKTARATSNLTLTTAAQSIVGDGDSTKVRLLIPSIGDWLIIGTFALEVTATDPDRLVGQLFVDDSGSPETGVAAFSKGDVLDLATVTQHWKVTTTAVNTPVELKALKMAAGGTGLAKTEHTTITAIGIAGGTTVAAPTDHGLLDGLGDTSDHAWATLVDGSRAFTGSQSMGSNKLTSLTAGSASGEAVEYDQLHSNAADHTQNTDTGTTQTTFGIDTDASTPKLRLSGQSGGTGDYTTYLYPAVLLTDNRLIILPNAAGVVALTSDLHNQAHGPSQHTEGTAWRVVYQDASGDEQEIALGSSAQVLTSNGTSSAPSFQAAGGGAVEHEAHITLVHSVSGTAF